MALDVLADEIVVRGRSELLSSMTGAYLTKRPNDIVNSGTFQHAIFSAVADVLVGESLNARTVGRSIPDSEVSGLRLDQRLAELRLPPRFAEIGSSGFVVIGASGGGGTITNHAPLTEANSNASFEAVVTSGSFTDATPVAIRAITTGPATNFPAGTVLTWSSPGSGLDPAATVQAPGLTGGRLAESDEQVRLRIRDARSAPAASGNSSTYIQLAENSGAHGVPVQKAFWYPACNGGGTGALAFVLTPGGPGTSRIPSSAQIGIVRAYILTVPEDTTRIPPGDDRLFDTTIVSQRVSLVLDIRWGQAAANWKDAARWPLRRSTGAGAIKVSAATDATHFTLSRDDATYTSETQPAAGQTVCFYNLSTGKFARKRILSFTGTGPWPIIVDTTNSSSDTTYVPIVGQRASPWSESLDDIATPILDFFDTLGPGEQLPDSLLFDPGNGQKRVPPTPDTWPAAITNHVVTSVLDVQAVANAIVQEGLGTVATVGSPGSVATLLELGDIAAFPL